MRRRVLIVEDGTEYIDAFRRLAPEGTEVEWLHAADAAAARRLLAEHDVDAVFLDLVFDRTPPESLAGDLEGHVARFSGDRVRAIEHLAAHQGFYVAKALGPAIPGGIPVLLACDLSGDPARLEALRQSLPTLEGVEEGASATKLVRRLLGVP